MCEAECYELAMGVKMLSEVYFPKEWLAHQAMEQMHDEDEALNRQKLAEAKHRLEITK